MLLLLLLFIPVLCSDEIQIRGHDAAAAKPDELLLVGTVDGHLEALRVSDGEQLWQFHTGSALLTSYTHDSVERLIPSIDGSLFLFDSAKGKLERVGVNIQELVQRAPTVTPDHAWTGTKTARMFVLDLDSGQVLREMATDFFLEQEHQLHRRNTILIGRADYVVKGMDRKPGHQQLWNMSFGKFIADDELESWDDSSPTTFEVGAEPEVEAKDRESGELLWKVRLRSQPVALYRVIRNAATGEATVVELTGNQRSRREKVISGAVTATKMGVHVLQFGEQVYAVPESAAVAPPAATSSEASSANAVAVANGLKTFYEVKKRNKRPRLIAPSPDFVEDEFDELEEALLSGESLLGDDSSTLLLLLSAAMGFVVAALMALVFWWRQRNTKAEVETTTTATPPLRMEVTDRVLGYGSCGTVVYEGRLEGRKIAVKRMLKAFYSVAAKESDILLQGADSHPFVVSYFLKEEDDKFVYLGLTYCSLTLGELFEAPSLESRNVKEVVAARKLALDNPPQLILELASGLNFLHSIGVVHRDLKPHNILITEEGHVQISDMGLAKKMDTTNLSFSTQTSGTVGYQAPEVLRGERQSAKLDVWGFGCLIYFVLSKGFHPFGDRLHREANIVAGKSSVYKVHDPVAVDLVSSCIVDDPARRPEMPQVLAHPFFWDAHKRLTFLLDVSDLLEALEGNVPATAEFEAMHRRVLGKHGKWQQMINNPLLLGDMGKYRRYQNTVKDLLRLIRNKSHHYRDLSPALQHQLGAHPDGYLAYFSRIFPNLFVQCFHFIAFSPRLYRQETVFRRYFEPTTTLPL